jgi:hypothetical protein
MGPACSLLAKFATAVINPALALLFAFAFLLFVWGIVEFMYGLYKGQSHHGGGHGDDPLKKGKEHMIWGVVGLTIMTSAWAIVRFIANTIGVGLGTC